MPDRKNATKDIKKKLQDPRYIIALRALKPLPPKKRSTK